MTFLVKRNSFKVKICQFFHEILTSKCPKKLSKGRGKLCEVSKRYTKARALQRTNFRGHTTSESFFIQKKLSYLVFLLKSTSKWPPLNWRSNPAPDTGFSTCGLPRALTKPETGEMIHVSWIHQSTKNRLMEEYLIYFHFWLMHQGIVPQREISPFERDWHVPENARNCSGWSSFPICLTSDPFS